MSNRLFQGFIQQMKNAIETTFGVIDSNGVVVACSNLNQIGQIRSVSIEEITSEYIVKNGCIYRLIGEEASSNYILFVDGESKDNIKESKILVISLNNLKELYDESYDKCSFVKNIISDNILPGDIVTKSKELNFDTEVKRVVYLIKLQGNAEIDPYEIVFNMFPDKDRNYIISTAEDEIVLVSDIEGDLSEYSPEVIAHQIIDTFQSEAYTIVNIGIGTYADSLSELARSYKEAQIALEVGKVFDTDKNIISYETLGIGRLIYQLPTTMCEMFLDEVLKKDALNELDPELLATIQSFFENNLNASQTARAMFAHRNTLTYRLDKIEKITGLDLKEFDNAVTLKVALMVKKYLDSRSANQ